MIYRPHTRFSNDFMAVVVKTNRPASAIAPEMIGVVRSTDASVPLDGIRPMADVTDQTVATRRLVVWLLSIFAGLALVLAALGLYAVMTAVVAERRICAFIQDRIGPNRVGPVGLLQPAADGVKAFFKEEMTPPSTMHWDLWLGPAPLRPFHETYYPGPRW